MISIIYFLIGVPQFIRKFLVVTLIVRIKKIKKKRLVMKRKRNYQFDSSFFYINFIVVYDSVGFVALNINTNPRIPATVEANRIANLE